MMYLFYYFFLVMEVPIFPSPCNPSLIFLELSALLFDLN